MKSNGMRSACRVSKPSGTDYIIASAHTFGGLWITRDYWTNLETGFAFSWMMEQYYRAVRQSLNVPEFDAIAHIGI